MNLLDLFVKIGINDEASAPMEQLSAGMIAKGHLIASAITSAVKNAVGAIRGLIESAIGAFGSYEQQIGGMQTFFGSAADTVISNAKRAYDTAGMSANQYMTNVSSFAMSLINSVAKRRQQVATEDTSVNKKELDAQVSDLQTALSKGYSERARALENGQRALQKALAAEVSAQQEANEEALDKRTKALEEEYERYSETLEREVEDYQNATDARIKEIDREYTESLKLIDKEEYERVKSIEKQIEALEKQTDAEREAQKKRNQQQKVADLREKAANAVYIEDRQKAEQDLSNTLEDIAQEEREAARKVQIQRLKDDKQAVKDRADTQRQELKDKKDATKTEWQEERSEGLKQLRATNKLLLKERQESNALELKEFRKNQQRLISSMQEANAQILEAQSDRNREELERLQESNSAKIAEAKRYAEEYAQSMEQAANAAGEAIQIAEEDRAEAARIADMAMRDMSDNVNKMGSDMASVENAYQGFAKQNFTMLDNLKLGYGGTAHEMQRLLDDAEAIKAKNGEVTEYSLDNFADIVDAIHVIQEESGITGTTAEEGATTIQGAINRAKAAWENWLVAITSPDADVPGETKTMMESVADAAALIIPRVVDILVTLSEEVGKRAPEIWQTFKSELENAMPDEDKQKFEDFKTTIEGICTAAETLAGGIKAVANVVSWAGKEVQGFIDTASGIATFLGEFPNLIQVAFGNSDALTDNGKAIINGFTNGAKYQWDFEGKGFFENIGGWIKAHKGPVEADRQLLVPAGQAIIEGLISGSSDIWNANNDLYSQMGEAIANVFSGAGNWLVGAGYNIMSGLMEGLRSGWETVSSFVGGIGNWIVEHKGPERYDRQLLVPAGKWIMGGFRKSLEGSFEREIMPYVSGMADAMEGAFGNPVLSPTVSGVYGRSTRTEAQHPRQLNVILELDRTQFGRLVYDLNQDETQRVGVRLAGGVA